MWLVILSLAATAMWSKAVRKACWRNCGGWRRGSRRSSMLSACRGKRTSRVRGDSIPAINTGTTFVSIICKKTLPIPLGIGTVIDRFSPVAASCLIAMQNIRTFPFNFPTLSSLILGHFNSARLLEVVPSGKTTRGLWSRRESCKNWARLLIFFVVEVIIVVVVVGGWPVLATICTRLFLSNAWTTGSVAPCSAPSPSFKNTGKIKIGLYRYAR